MTAAARADARRRGDPLHRRSTPAGAAVAPPLRREEGGARRRRRRVGAAAPRAGRRRDRQGEGGREEGTTGRRRRRRGLREEGPRPRERPTEGDEGRLLFFPIWDEEGRDRYVFVEGALRCSDRWSEPEASIEESNG